MAKEFLGNGWSFPLLPDETGKLGYVGKEDNIAQSLEILLLTALGERVMRPGFGSKAARLAFAPGSVRYLRLLETTVREAVVQWEPRVSLENVRAETDLADETRVLVSIDYRVRGANSRENLVFPFYVGGVEVRA